MVSYAEITYFEASEGYKSGTANLDQPLAQISKADGLKKSYVGYQTEAPSVLFWVNDWETKDNRDAFSNRADYADIVNASRPAFGSEPTVLYVEFEDTNGALGAPATEFVTFTLKEGNDMAQLEPLVQELHRRLPGTPRFHGDSWAPVLNRPNAYIGILGWDTVEAHWDAVREGPLKEVVDQVKEVADLWLVHAELKGFSA